MLIQGIMSVPDGGALICEAGLIQDEVAPKLREIRDEVDVLRKDVNNAVIDAQEKGVRVSEKFRDAEKDIETRKELFFAKLSRIAIPATAIGMMACVVAGWAVIGGSVGAMRGEIRQLSGETAALKANVEEKQGRW